MARTAVAAAVAGATGGEHLRALTGVRFFAALWVVVYHVTRHHFALLSEHHHALFHAIFPVTAAGVRGVDLFFLLSGFVLALNYLDRLGGRFEPRATLRFVWLRLARIWPLFMLVVLVAGLLKVVRHQLWDSAPVGQLTWSMLLKQALLVHQWFPPERGQSSWNGPGWSLSAEWLAYLLFPVLALVVARGARRLRARTLFALAVVVMAPLVLAITRTHGMGGSVWVPRILCEFTAGMLLCAGASRLRLTDRLRRAAGWGAVASVVAAVVFLYLVRAPRFEGWVSTYVVLLFVPLVACLAVGTGPLHDLLATRALVLGGGLSYALYLVHSPLLYLFRDVTRFTGVFYLDPLTRVYAELAFVPVLVLVAWALFRFFEEPVRRWMRRLVEPSGPPSRAAVAVPPPREDRAR